MAFEELSAQEKRVLEIVAAKVDRAPEELPLDATFESLGFESTDALDILFALEDEFHIDIPNDKAGNVKTIRCLFQCVAGN